MSEPKIIDPSSMDNNLDLETLIKVPLFEADKAESSLDSGLNPNIIVLESILNFTRRYSPEYANVPNIIDNIKNFLTRITIEELSLFIQRYQTEHPDDFGTINLLRKVYEERINNLEKEDS